MRLVHVVEPWVMVTRETTATTVQQIADLIRSGGAELLKECENKVRNAGIEVDTELIETTRAPAGECIGKKAQEVDADLIICGTHGRRGVRRVLIGSDAEYILRRAPVLLVRNQESAAREAA
jgi:nucleotide-binding universal stress UspA family protein